ncbi:MAG: hypothetical protein QNJ16_18520 [Rhodobacter sp.]|nr:hypothetical protein [Rhodobacter sp.]
MKTLRKLACLLPLLALFALGACSSNVVATKGPPPGGPADIAALTQAIRALGPEVDPEEAARAARITYEHTHELAIAYEITDPPLIHNTKVNMGIKPRGLCKDWADDIEARLALENFQTLDLHRAIANADNLRIEHSTTIVSRRGDGPYDGIVVDPWRNGGVLYWGKVLEDEKYKWVPRQEVFAMKRARSERQGRFGAMN